MSIQQKEIARLTDWYAKSFGLPMRGARIEVEFQGHLKAMLEAHEALFDIIKDDAPNHATMLHDFHALTFDILVSRLQFSYEGGNDE
jgi:hypothetical protein